MTAISFAMLLGLIGFVAVIFVKLLPVYLENFKITAALKGLENDVRVEGASASEIRNLLLKKLQIDDVGKIGEKDIIITRERGKPMTVTINNETRIHMFGNVDAVVVYKGPVINLR